MKKLIIALMAFALSFSLSCYAQTISFSTAPNPGVDYSRLKYIDSVISDCVAKDKVNGVVTIIIKDSQLIQWKGYGYLDKDTRVPMPKDAIFRIMSQTKAIVSAGIMILYERGKLTLDEPVADFIPEFKNQRVLDKFNPADSSYTTVPAKRNITIRDLLTHSGGLDYTDIGSRTGSAIYTKAGIPSGLGYFNANLLDRMKALGKLPLMFQPGTKFQYSLSCDLLGCLIEVISKQNLEDFLHDNIFKPLGMKDTYFNLPASKAARLATVYTEDSLHHVIKWSHTFRHIDPDYPLMKKTYFSGGAGLSSTAFDYAVFMQMMLNVGLYNGHRVLSPRTVQLMTSGQLDFTYNGHDNFGLGFGITSSKSAARNPRNEGSFNWGGYYGTTYWADPKARLVCLIMTQQTPDSADFFGRVEDVIYSGLVK